MLGRRDGRPRNSRIGRGPTKTIWQVHSGSVLFAGTDEEFWELESLPTGIGTLLQ